METQDNMENKNYGPASDGTYLTPYILTVVCNKESLLEVAVSAMLTRAQVVSCADAVECNYITPYILLFGNGYERQDIDKFFDRGFQSIQLCVEEEFWEKYLENGIVYDSRLLLFKAVNLPSIVNFENVMQLYVLDHILCALYPNYVSDISDKINNENGRAFIAGMTGGDFVSKIKELVNSYRCYDLVDSILIKGNTMRALAAENARRRLNEGIQLTTKTGESVLLCTGYTYAVLEILPSQHDKIIFVDFDPLSRGFLVTAIGKNCSEFLRVLEPSSLTTSQATTSAKFDTAGLSRVLASLG